MELYVPPTLADEIISISKSFNVEAQIVGRVEESPIKKLTLETTLGTYEYN